MSKPNLLSFGTSIGFYRNHRVLAARDGICKIIRRKISFGEIAPLLFQVVMAYAAENQLDGNFAGYSAQDWKRVFASNNVEVSAQEASLIIKTFKAIGLFDGDKIRSWMKFNRHLADYEGIQRAKARAAKLMHKKREQEARGAIRNGPVSPSEPEKIPARNAAKSASKTDSFWRDKKQLELIEEQLREAHDPEERKTLKQLRRDLQGRLTGVARKTSPPPSPAPAPARAATARRMPQKKFDQVLLENARALIAEGQEDLVTENMVRALLRAGEALPAKLAAKFSLVVHGHEFSETSNPVPG